VCGCPGAHPHEAKHYNDELEAAFKEVHAHPLCVSWGEIGLVCQGFGERGT
jgi:TatD DNase family protein